LAALLQALLLLLLRHCWQGLTLAHPHGPPCHQLLLVVLVMLLLLLLLVVVVLFLLLLVLLVVCLRPLLCL
jgi:hypothetical protein